MGLLCLLNVVDHMMHCRDAATGGGNYVGQEVKNLEGTSSSRKIQKRLICKINHLGPNGEEKGPEMIKISMTALFGVLELKAQGQFHRCFSHTPSSSRMK